MLNKQKLRISNVCFEKRIAFCSLLPTIDCCCIMFRLVRILFLCIIISSIDAESTSESEELNETMENLLNALELDPDDETDSDDDEEEFLGNIVPIKLIPIGEPQGSDEEMGAKYKCNANGCKMIRDGDDDDTNL